MFLKRLLISFLFFLTFFSTFGKSISIKDVKFYVVVLNQNNGNVLKISEIKIVNVQTSNIIKLQNDKNESYYLAPENSKIKVSVKSVGFYDEEIEYESSNFRDGEYLEIRMNPKPSGSLKIKTVDSETKTDIDSEINVEYFAKNQYEKINKDNPFLTFYYEVKGTYKVICKAIGYEDKIIDVNLEISADQVQKNLSIELTKIKANKEITFLDKSSNNIIKDGDVWIKHKNKNVVIFEGKIVEGIIKFAGLLGQTYQIKCKSIGFADFNFEFAVDEKPLKFDLSPVSIVEIDVFDAETEKRIEVEVELISPSKKVHKVLSSASEVVKFYPNEAGNYSVNTNVKNYTDKTEQLNITSLNGGTSFITFRLKKGFDEFNINVFDSETKLALNEAKVRVFSGLSKEIEGKMDKNKMTVSLDETKKYFFQVNCIGYIDYKANISFDRSIQVFIKKTHPIQYTKLKVKILDFSSNQEIETARLIAFDKDKKQLFFSYNKENKYFESDSIVQNKQYSCEASSANYKTENLDFETKLDIVTIKLKPNNIEKYQFIAFDEFLQKEIKADFKLMSGTKDWKLVANKNGIWNTELSKSNTYSVEIKSKDYKTLVKNLDFSDENSNIFKINVQKESYKVLLKFDLSINRETLDYKKIKIKNQSKNIVFIPSFENNGFFVNIDPNVEYNISVDFNGYNSLNHDFNFGKLKIKNLEYTLDLVKKTELPKAIEQKIENISEKTIAQTPAPAPSANIVIGEKFSLEGFNFKQGQTVLLESSFKQLDQLVEILKSKPSMRIEITGHSDNEGNDQRLNERLSSFRAKYVSNYLFNKGVISDKITLMGKGSKEPIAPNDTEENRAKNRRVEVQLFED